jgi:hypothetical protein
MDLPGSRDGYRCMLELAESTTMRSEPEQWIRGGSRLASSKERLNLANIMHV